MLALWLTGCAHKDHTFDPVDLAALPGPKEHPNADGVVLLREREVVFYEEGGEVVLEETVHQRSRVFRARGKRLARVLVPIPNLVELTGFAARAVEPDGRVHHFGRGDVEDVPHFPGYALYSDARALQLDVDWLPAGSLFEVKYTTRRKDPRLWPVTHAFGDGVPVAEERLVVRVPEGWELASRSFVIEEPVEFPPLVRREGGQVVHVWERKHQRALRREPYGPEGPLGEVVWAHLTSWQVDGEPRRGLDDARALSRYYFELTQDRAAVTPAIEAAAREILRGVPSDPWERASRLYAWTQRIQYCAVSIGMGGWIPHEAATTEKVRYGDCKDKANLLRALLKTQGVESYLAPVYAHSGLPRAFRTPTLIGNANHAILVVELPDRTVIADPTSPVVPFGRLPPSDQGADLVPGTAEGSDVVKTPWSFPAENGRRFVADVALRPGQRLEGSFSVELRGASADALRGQLLYAPPDHHDELVNEELPMRSTRVDEVRIDGGDVPLHDAPTTAVGRFRGPALGDGSSTLLRAADLLSPVVPALLDEARTQPVVLRVPEREEHRVTLRLPEGATVGALPAPGELDGPFGRYTLRYEARPGVLEVHRSYERFAAIVPAEDYAALRALFEEISLLEARPVVVRLEAGEEGA